MLRLLDTFSGIGGFSYAAEQLVGGFETIGFVEREPFCQQILRKHWPDVPIYDDITTFSPEPGSADVICGGFPCQDISTAGKQAGIKEGTRSGLFYELMRVIRMVQPQYVILENVAAILANGLDTVLGELAAAGFDAEWACIPASAVGACHQRDRWWLVAYPQSRGWRARQGQGTRQAGYQSTGTGNQSAGSDASHPTNVLSDGSATEYAGQSAGRPQPQLGNGYGADVANSNNQRQQEQHAAAIADQQRRPCWNDAPRRLNPDWRSYVSEPVLCRGDDGLSGRVDRLKALGNAVVPQVAAIPLLRVKELASSN
jgi:DNA (cytosine-5)-methyltransferase 1